MNGINEEILIILENINTSDLDEKRKNELNEVIESIKSTSIQLLENKEKVGIMVSMNKRFSEISNLLDSLEPYTVQNQSFKTRLLEIVDLSKKVTELSNQGRLEFLWKSTPPLSNRLILNNFTPQEKVIYLVKIKGNEVADGLEQVLIDLNDQLKKRQSFDKDLFLDLSDLIEMVEDSKKEIDKIN